MNCRDFRLVLRTLTQSLLNHRWKIVWLETMNSEFAALFKLDRAERLQLVEDLWDSIVNEESESEPAVPDWKRDELRQRKARFASHPASARTWEQVKERARSRHD